MTTTIITLTSLSLLLLLFHPLLTKSQPGRTNPPSSASQGQWRLLQSNLGISPMHMQLLHNNKVVMFDRTDSGRSNLTFSDGRCRFDPDDTQLQIDCTAHSVLYDVTTNKIRPLTIQTDTWCSSGAVLPNGTLLQTGGFHDGDHVVRMFTPRYGDDDNNDWVEYPDYLNRRRWYATNQILPDGRVIIVGGRRQYNYEFYPSDSKLYWLDFLRETRDGRNENNLYPFVHLLPDGNLFIFSNTRSILFDYDGNRVLTEFPEIPGGDPRNYPSSGSSVLLPLVENATAPTSIEVVEVMVCGGAPQGAVRSARAGEFARAISSCGRLRVSDRNPNWEMETMPLERVMGDMLLLPTGDVIVINGAGRGTAGWENGREPVTAPVIYRPSAPQIWRFSVMAASPTARMYHSSAILLGDGRILVGGSNPHVFYNFTGVLYPTELKLDAFSPPYLSPAYDPVRPRIVGVRAAAAPAAVRGYGEEIRVSFCVTRYLTRSAVSVRIVAPSFTTHSFAMNQRMVVLRIVDVKQKASDMYTVTVVGPSTAEIAPPGYYMMFVVHAGIPSSCIWIKLQSR
ncbi:unnamed protein product [Linum tenue]|uniref:Galactose oxidase n=2 Tax=Linum tenue TaxID=586396 RepID=A0AAV0JTI5_9ROSI|nr:unnamed protein product [Linum tenue]